MSEFNDVRSRLRGGARAAEPKTPPRGSGGRSYFWLILICAFAVGGGIMLMMPRLAPLKPSASIPTFQEVRDGGALHEPPPASATQRSSGPADYAADPEELGKAADSVCFQRAHTAFPSWSKTPRLTTKEKSDFDLKELKHFNELMTCLLTEAPPRYCSASQRRMITAEVISYFAGIDYLNKTLDKVRALRSANRQFADFDLPPIGTAEADPRVIRAIEARVRDGLFGKPELDRINSSLPERLRDRFSTVARAPSKCPAPPWWAIWR